jgi:glycine cleavage system H protein
MSGYLEHTADKFVFKAKRGLLYTRDEVWVAREGKLLRVGVTDFAQRRGGDIVFADLAKPGTRVERGAILGSYETVKMISDILSPVAGVVREVNGALDAKPELLNSDPYGAGWVAVIEPDAALEGLLTAEEYFEAMKAGVAEALKKIKGQ